MNTALKQGTWTQLVLAGLVALLLPGCCDLLGTCPGPDAPSAPAGLTAVLEEDGVRLRWVDRADDEDGSWIERCTGAGCAAFEVLAEVAPGTTQYADRALVRGAVHRYRVQAFNAAGGSSYSNVAEATVPSAGGAPNAPSALVAVTRSSERVALTWTDASSNESGFRIEHCTGTGCTSFVEQVVVNAGSTGHELGGLAARTVHRFRIRAFNADGYSAYSNIAEATTPAGATVPAAPSGLSASATSSSRIRLTWSDQSNDEKGFRVARCPGSACTQFTEVTTLDAGAVSHDDGDLAPATTYRYQVRAFNDAGESQPSNIASATTPAAPTVPAAPSALVASSTGTTWITLGWTDNASNETGFRVERCLTASCSFSEVKTVGAGVTTYQDTGLTAATQYTYRVRAYNSLGASAYSNSVSATTRALARRVRIVNNGSTSVMLKDVVRLKLAATTAGFGDADLLSDDRFTMCQDISTVDSIPPGSSRTFDQNIGSSFAMWMSMGRWETDFFFCSTVPFVWDRRLSFQTTSGGPLYYVYVSLNVTGHQSGTMDFVITGSYLEATLKVTASQDGTVIGSVPFSVTQ